MAGVGKLKEDELDVPAVSVGEMSADGITQEEEEELERQILMSPPIIESPCPSELDDNNSRAGSRMGESILGDEDVTDEEQDLSLDGDDIVPDIDESNRESLKGLTAIEKFRKQAVAGMRLFMMGKLDEARKLFIDNENLHPLMAQGCAFVDLFEALAGFNEASFPGAKNRVARGQKICKMMMHKNRRDLKHQKGVVRGSLPEAQLASVVGYYEARVSIADCWCLTGVLTACKMAMMAYVRAGVQLHRAFKIYVKVYRELNDAKIIKLRFPGESGARERERLLTSASFGYGIFHLVLSLVPPTQTALLKLIGMTGDRRTGLLALRYCFEKGWGAGLEARAPFALLALLWYYVFLRPMVTLSKLERQKSIVYAKTLIRQYRNIGDSGSRGGSDDTATCNTSDVPAGDLDHCVLFAFIKMRIARNAGRIEDCIKIIEKVLDEHGKKEWMKELNQILKHDISWCKMAQMKFASAGKMLMELHELSRWSKLKNFYPALLTQGVRMNNDSPNSELADFLKKVNELKKAKVKKVLNSGNQQEMFCQSRACLILETLQLQSKAKTKNDRYISDKDLVHKVCEILLYECTFHWGFFPRAFTQENLQKKVMPCLKSMEGDRDFDSLSQFLQGSVHRYLNNFDDAEKALLVAKEAKLCHKRLKLVQAYACIELAYVFIQKVESKDPRANEENKIVEGEEISGYLSDAKKMRGNYDMDQRIQFLVHNFTKTGDELWTSSKNKNSLAVPKHAV